MALEKENRAAAFLDHFRLIAGEQYVLLDDESLQNYGHDETENLLYLPDVVIRPRTTAEDSSIMKICHQHRIPVTPRGAGTGLSGGASASTSSRERSASSEALTPRPLARS